METNFFRIIEKLGSGSSWTFRISPGADGRLIVSVLLSHPEGEKSGVQLTPMIFNETPLALDQQLFDKLREPVNASSELWRNASEYQKSLAAARQLLAEKQKSASKSKPTENESSAQKKKAFDEAMKTVNQLNASCKYKEALEALPSITDYPDHREELERLRDDLETRSKQLSLL